MQVSEHRDKDHVTLLLNGRLDAFTAPAFEKKVMDLIKDGVRIFELDCQNIKYISSAGLKVLLMALKAIQPYNGKISIRRAPANVKEVMDCTGFSAYIDLIDENMREGNDENTANQ